MSNIYGKKPNLDSYTKAEVDAFLLAKTDKLNGKLKQDQVPDLAITNVFTGSLTDRINLVNNNTIESGDVFIQRSYTSILLSPKKYSALSKRIKKLRHAERKTGASGPIPPLLQRAKKLSTR